MATEVEIEMETEEAIEMAIKRGIEENHTNSDRTVILYLFYFSIIFMSMISLCRIPLLILIDALPIYFIIYCKCLQRPPGKKPSRRRRTSDSEQLRVSDESLNSSEV